MSAQQLCEELRRGKRSTDEHIDTVLMSFRTAKAPCARLDGHLVWFDYQHKGRRLSWAVDKITGMPSMKAPVTYADKGCQEQKMRLIEFRFYLRTILMEMGKGSLPTNSDWPADALVFAGWNMLVERANALMTSNAEVFMKG